MKKILEIKNQEQLLEVTAMRYNGNPASAKDSVYFNKLSQVRYVYARDVISRFTHYTPDGVAAGEYYEWNPNSKKWVYKSDISAKTY